MSDPIGVLVVDDSALMRKLIPQMLLRDSSIHVLGTAVDGATALRKVEELKPDVVTLDLEMPGMNGMEVLRELTRARQTAVLVVSAHSTEGASATFKALGLGAFDFIAKPRDAASARMEEIAEELIRKIKAAAQVDRSRQPLQMPLEFAAPAAPPQPKPRPRNRREPSRIVAIGVSTGGPNALQGVLAQLPGDFPASIVVVQHMPEGFTEMFARRLNEACAVDVKEAQSGDLLLAGRVLICPGNRHIRLRRASAGAMAVLSDEPRVNGHRPSVDVLFRSLAHEFGPSGIAVLMTGMGDDGADAMGEVKTAGGLTIAQRGDSCVVFGMPRAAIERGHAMRVVSLDTLSHTLLAQCALRQPVEVGGD